MGVSTDGQMCFGVPEEETDGDFPWREPPYNGDIDDWWLFGIHGFRHSVELFDDAGEWLPGKEADQVQQNRYYAEKREFIDTIPPLPVSFVNACSGDVPEYILIVPETERSARRGYPVVFRPEELVVPEAALKTFLEFLAAYGITHSEPQWYLSSYWG